MTEFSHTQEALAKSIGKSRSHVANSIRLLTLPEQVKQYLTDGLISAGHARAILSVPQADILSFTKEIVKKGLNVRQAEKLSKNFGAKVRKQEAPKKEKDSDVVELEQEISKILGMKISISSKETGGILSIHYNNLEQLDQIIKSLASNKEHFEALPIKNNEIIEEESPTSEITEASEIESIDDDVMIETSEAAEELEQQPESLAEGEIEAEQELEPEENSTEEFEIPENLSEDLDIQAEEDNEKLESSLGIEAEETIEPDENISKEALDMLEQEIETEFEPEKEAEEDMIDIDEMMEDVVKQIKESE
jgi:ParB family chromosome partitioning protein